QPRDPRAVALPPPAVRVVDTGRRDRPVLACRRGARRGGAGTRAAGAGALEGRGAGRPAAGGRAAAGGPPLPGAGPAPATSAADVAVPAPRAASASPAGYRLPLHARQRHHPRLGPRRPPFASGDYSSASSKRHSSLASSWRFNPWRMTAIVLSVP